jgi:hypothetical protein
MRTLSCRETTVGGACLDLTIHGAAARTELFELQPDLNIGLNSMLAITKYVISNLWPGPAQMVCVYSSGLSSSRSLATSHPSSLVMACCFGTSLIACQI